MKSKIPVTYTITNDFILKSMNVNYATVNINSFNYAILCAYMERNFKLDGDLDI
jgi:hypothetical protein